MAKKGFKGLNMLVLGLGLLLVVLFFLGAYKVKEGFADEKTKTKTESITGIDKDQKSAFLRLKSKCLTISDGDYEQKDYTYNNDATIDDVTYTTNKGLIMATGKCTRTYSYSDKL